MTRAKIGYHTFHLHEIYGLTSSTSAPPPPAATTYPPTQPPAPDASYDFAGQECVLCLSSPREVVLLPCRHLVACKECALNMVEFGAGGSVQHATEAEPTPPAAEPTQDQATASEPAGAPPMPGVLVVPTPAPAAPPRRKRKPKGWFCPVCRQRAYPTPPRYRR